MFSMFPFNNNFNNQNNNNNRNITDLGLFNNLFNEDLINNMIDQIMSSDFISDLTNDILEDDYNIDFKDYGDYYLIKGYLPGLSPKDISIDFEKNKAILTIKKKKVYSSNGGNAVMTVIQSGGNLVKNFYIEEVNVGKLRASFDNNVLMITLPKLNKLEERIPGAVDSSPEIIDVDDFKIE